jgi:hypothetical protein
VNRRCASCNRVFAGLSRDLVYCSPACRARAWRTGQLEPEPAAALNPEVPATATVTAFIEILRRNPDAERLLRAILRDRELDQALRERLLPRDSRGIQPRGPVRMPPG